MRNLKKLLAVAIVVAMMVTAMVPAFAAATTTYTYSTEASSLKDLGLMTGNGTDLNLGGKLTREQGLTLFLAMFGLTKDAQALSTDDVAAALKDYKDASKISGWAKNFVAYAIKNGIAQGANNVWGPQDNLTGKMFAKMIANQLKADSVNYDTAVSDLAKLDGNTLSADEAAALDNKALIRDDAAGIIFGALTVKNGDNTIIANYVGTDADLLKAAQDAGLMQVAGDIAATASATGVKKITVKFNQPIDPTKATYTVKRDDATLSVATATPSTDKTSVDLIMGARLIAGDYTVTVKGLTTNDLSLAITGVQDEQAAKIDIPATQLASITDKNGNIYELQAAYKVYNQYGEDITTAATTPSIQWTTSFGQNPATGDSSNGYVDVYCPGYGVNQATPTYFTMGASVALTGIVSNSSTVFTKTFTVGAQASIDSITFDKVYSKNGDSFTSSESAYNNFTLLFTAKDQYGNSLNASQVNANAIISSSNPSVVTTALNGGSGDQILVKDSQGPNNNELGLDMGDPSAKTDGTATIRFISKTTGKSFTFDVSVAKPAMVNTFTLQAPSNIVGAGETVDIPFTALDQTGAKVTDYNTLTAGVNSQGAVQLSPSNLGNGGSFGWVHDYVGNSAFAQFVAPSVAGTYTIMAMCTTTGKISQITINVKNKANASVIEGFSSGFVTGVAVNASYNVDYSNLIIHDQYDRSFDMTGTDPSNSKTVFPAVDTNTKVNGSNVYRVSAPYTGNGNGKDSNNIITGNFRIFVKQDSPSTNNKDLKDVNGYVQLIAPSYGVYVEGDNTNNAPTLTTREDTESGYYYDTHNNSVTNATYGVAIYSNDTGPSYDMVTIKGIAKGSATVDYELQWYDGVKHLWTTVAGSQYQSTVTVTDKGSISSYEVADIPTVLDQGVVRTKGLTASNYEPGITVNGVMSNGAKVALDKSDYDVAFDNSGVQDVGNDIVANCGNYPAGQDYPAGSDSFTTNGSATDSTITVNAIITVHAGGAPVLTKSFKVSNSTPAAASIALDTGYDGHYNDYTQASVSGDTYEAKYQSAGLISIQMPQSADLLTYAAIRNVVKDAINITDQYGQEIPLATTDSVVITNIVNAAGNDAYIMNGGTKIGESDAGSNQLNQGGSFNATVISNGKTLTFKVSIN